MATLTARQRKALPKAKFAGPGRSFPVPDAKHARAALMDVGSAPASARPKIKARARAVLNKAK